MINANIGNTVGASPPRRGGTPKPITINGVTYPSQSAAAKALGVHVSTVSNAKRRGKLHTIGVGCGALGAEPVAIRGFGYSSQSAAAKALGVSSAAISQAAKNGTLDRAGLRKNSKAGQS